LIDLPILTRRRCAPAEQAALHTACKSSADEQGWRRCRSGSHEFFRTPGRCIVSPGKDITQGRLIRRAVFRATRMENRSCVSLSKKADCSDLMRKKLGTCAGDRLRFGRCAIESGECRSGHHAYRILAGRHRPDSHDAEFKHHRSGFRRCCSACYSGWFAWRRRKNHRSASDPRCLSRHQSTAKNKGGLRLAVDLPTGLDTDSRQARSRLRSRRFYRYNWYAKPGLVADGALNYVGRLEVVPLDELRSPETKPKEIIASPQLFAACFQAEAQLI